MSDVGWISLHRKIQDCFLWDLKPFSWGQAWIDLLLMANHKDAKIVFDGKVVTVGMGQRITSIRKLADRWGWSRTKVTNFLNVLEEEQMIERTSDTKKTLLTIVNYEKYQAVTENESHRSDTEKPQKSTNNNDNNDNNENNNIPPLSPRGEEWRFDKHTNVENGEHIIHRTDYKFSLDIQMDLKLRQAIKDWLKYKDEKKPKSTHHYTESGLKSLLNKFARASKEFGCNEVIRVVEDSMSSNYSGIVWDKMRKEQMSGREKFLSDRLNGRKEF